MVNTLLKLFVRWQRETWVLLLATMENWKLRWEKRSRDCDQVLSSFVTSHLLLTLSSMSHDCQWLNHMMYTTYFAVRSHLLMTLGSSRFIHSVSCSEGGRSFTPSQWRFTASLGGSRSTRLVKHLSTPIIPLMNPISVNWVATPTEWTPWRQWKLSVCVCWVVWRVWPDNPLPVQHWDALQLW